MADLPIGAVKADRCSCGRCRPELVSDDCSAVPVLFWMYTPDGEAEFAADPILCRRACPWCGSALLIIDDQPWVIPAGRWEAMARDLALRLARHVVMDPDKQGLTVQRILANAAQAANAGEAKGES